MYLIHQPIFDEYSILELALFFPLLSSDSNLKLLLTPCMTTEYEARLRFLAKLPTSHSREGIFFLEPYMIAEHCISPVAVSYMTLKDKASIVTKQDRLQGGQSLIV